jgi:hypothetical protein
MLNFLRTGQALAHFLSLVFNRRLVLIAPHLWILSESENYCLTDENGGSTLINNYIIDHYCTARTYK